MSGQVALEDAYAEACKALGEAVVMQRLMGQENERLLTALDETHQRLADPESKAR
jgi:hypothetical protein